MNIKNKCLVECLITQGEAIEFQALCKKCYNINLTLEEAESQASSIVMFLESLDKSDQDMLSSHKTIDTVFRKDNYGSR